MSENIFKAVNGVYELLGQMVGAGSMCWENVGAAGVFDSDEAARIVRDGTERLSQLIGGMASGADRILEQGEASEMTRWQRFLELFGCKPTAAQGFDGCSMTSRCKRCKHRILQDSQGNWFPARAG